MKENQKEENINFRILKLKLENNEITYGFHLIRTQWDPFPRVHKVDEHSIANKSGIISGDFIIEINNENVLGISIENIIKIVKSSLLEINLKLWNPGLEHPFIDIMKSIVSLLSCPICTSDIAKRPRQCRNGHLICTNCAMKTMKCPICRAPLRRPPNNNQALPGGRCLVAEKLTSLFQSSGLVTYSNPAIRQDERNKGDNNENIEPTNNEETANNSQQQQRGVKRRNALTSKIVALWRDVLP